MIKATDHIQLDAFETIVTKSLLPTKDMHRFLMLLTLLACCDSIYAAPAEKQSTEKQSTKSIYTCMDRHATRVIVGKRDEHHFTIVLSDGPLRTDRHHFENKKGEMIPADKIKVDGSEFVGQISMDRKFDIIGTDYALPSTEFYAFDVMVDGKKWVIPEKLWTDCFAPNLYIPKNSSDSTVWSTLSPDGTSLTIGMWGGDGGGAYRVIWYLHADSHHSRKIIYGD